MTGITFDASELTELGRRLAKAEAVSHLALAASVKKGAQKIKEATQTDISSSGNRGIRQVRIRYETGQDGRNVEYADIGPEDTGRTKKKSTGPSVAAIAFYGTARGGGTHQEPYKYAADELPTLADYVGDAAGDALDALIWG